MGAPRGGLQVFFDGGARYTVARWADDASAGGGQILARHEARWVLSRVLGPSRGPEVVTAYRTLIRGALRASFETDVGRMRDAILDAAARGHVLVFETRLIGSSTRREVDEAEAAPAKPIDREEKTWIEIVLVDDDDPPAPVPFVGYKIELPDGSTRTGILDAFGKARLDGIDPGSCKVSFPGFDARDWS